MKIHILTSIAFVFFTVTIHAQIEMNSSGEVGIGADPVSGIDFFTPEAKITRLGINVTPSSTFYLNASLSKIQSLVVGITNTYPSGAELKAEGESYFYGTYASAALKFESRQYYSSYYTRIVPTVNNVCDLGTSSYAFRTAYAYYFSELSDKRQKENIQNINDALGIVMNLNGVRYDLKKEYAFDESLDNNEEEKTIRDADRKNNIGFLAQDVHNILPEVVIYDDSADVYSVCYTRLIPVLVEAMKEQQAQIETLEHQITSLESSAYKGASTKTESAVDQLNLTSELFQNAPNPFTDETTINYSLGESVKGALIYVYDMTGKQLKSFELHHSDDGKIVFSSGEFQAGMYLYTMIADGQVIGSKQMILTER